MDTGALTASERVWLALWLAASVTLAVKLKVPVWLVVPESWPPFAREKPVGSDPDVTVHWYGEAPPLADSR